MLTYQTMWITLEYLKESRIFLIVFKVLSFFPYSPLTCKVNDFCGIGVGSLSANAGAEMQAASFSEASVAGAWKKIAEIVKFFY